MKASLLCLFSIIHVRNQVFSRRHVEENFSVVATLVGKFAKFIYQLINRMEHIFVQTSSTSRDFPESSSCHHSIYILPLFKPLIQDLGKPHYFPKYHFISPEVL